jgi:hypothetical protein
MNRTYRLDAPINDATQYATMYDEDDRPVATLCRRRVGETGPNWQAYDTDGKLLCEAPLSYIAVLRTARALRRRAQNAE